MGVNWLEISMPVDSAGSVICIPLAVWLSGAVTGVWYCTEKARESALPRGE